MTINNKRYYITPIVRKTEELGYTKIYVDSTGLFFYLKPEDLGPLGGNIPYSPTMCLEHYNRGKGCQEGSVETLTFSRHIGPSIHPQLTDLAGSSHRT